MIFAQSTEAKTSGNDLSSVCSS